MIQLLLGDCRERLKELPDCSVDSIVTDPPYELGFMGKSWDASGVAYDVTVWQECLRVLKHGGHLLSFGGSRTYHRMACAIEDAGFQIRDQIMWVYGSGFPKSLNVGKQDGCEEWDGWGTALKPAHEPIVLARKPLDGTVANNVLTHGVGGINIDGCRVAGEPVPINKLEEWSGFGQKIEPNYEQQINTQGRFPANFIHDGSDEVLQLFPDSKGGAYPAKRGQAVNTDFASGQETEGGFRAMGDSGSAARFFYCAKASKKDRNEGLDGFAEWTWKDQGFRDNDSTHLSPRAGAGRTSSNANHHPTVKPTDLMRYLCRLITPSNGTVLDPFTGSGSTGKAAVLEGFNFIGVEQSAEYIAIAQARIESAIK
jgi:DNA modification methylase